MSTPASGAPGACKRPRAPAFRTPAPPARDRRRGCGSRGRPRATGCSFARTSNVFRLSAQGPARDVHEQSGPLRIRRQPVRQFQREESDQITQSLPQRQARHRLDDGRVPLSAPPLPKVGCAQLHQVGVHAAEESGLGAEHAGQDHRVSREHLHQHPAQEPGQALGPLVVSNLLLDPRHQDRRSRQFEGEGRMRSRRSPAVRRLRR